MKETVKVPAVLKENGREFRHWLQMGKGPKPLQI